MNLQDGMTGAVTLAFDLQWCFGNGRLAQDVSRMQVRVAEKRRQIENVMRHRTRKIRKAKRRWLPPLLCDKRECSTFHCSEQ